MDHQIFKDRILETENLTDQLEDSDANWLINWGISQLSQVLLDVTNEEIAGEKVNALMAVMRKINRICGWRQSKRPEDLAADLEILTGLFSTAFNANPMPPAPTQSASAANYLANLETTQQALEFLTSMGTKPVMPD